MAAGLVLAAVGGVGGYALLHDSSYVATPGHLAPQARPAQAAVALQSLTEALDAGDQAAAAALAPAADPAAAGRLRAVAGNARLLGIRPTWRYVDESGGVSADGSWAAAVDLTWRYAGDSGTGPGQAEVVVDFATAGADRVAVTGFGSDQSGRVPVWLAGPVTVRRAPGVLVVDAGSDAERYLRLARTAVRVVHRVLPGWRDPLVVEVPASSEAVDRALDAEPGHTRAIAAVTAPIDGSTTGDAPVHVFVNPDVFGRLRATGSQVVLSHEAVHVATDAARSPAPTWLVEGFADYVALRDVDLPVRTTAGQIIREVRREGVPAALPGPQEFDTATTHLGATYESAWLACVLLANDGGEAALVRLYHQVDAGHPLGQALRAGFGLTEPELTRAWQARLAALAG